MMRYFPLFSPVQPSAPTKSAGEPCDEPRGKMAMRRASLTVRDAMSPEARAAASEAIATATNVLLASRLVRGATVALYVAKGSEVDTARIDAAARAAGLIVAYPRVIGAGALAFHAVTRDALVPAGFGLREPSAAATPIALADIAAFIVPGLAFDRAGGRLGWGKGHYDATFAASPASALRIGVGFACQLVERVTREPHDVALHGIITEDATYLVD
jgi:5-formyltetrahydrofolate cyclo-ligase